MIGLFIVPVHIAFRQFANSPHILSEINERVNRWKQHKLNHLDVSKMNYLYSLIIVILGIKAFAETNLKEGDDGFIGENCTLSDKGFYG